MARTLRHFVLNGLGKNQNFKGPRGGAKKRLAPVQDRALHAQALLGLLDKIPKPAIEGRPGVYLDIQGRAGEELSKDSLDKSGLQLLTYREPNPQRELEAQAAVFATPEGLENLRKKISDYETKIDKRSQKPKNAALVQNIGLIVEAGLRALWRSPGAVFPTGPGVHSWEIWLDPDGAHRFIDRAGAQRVVFATDRLVFPEALSSSHTPHKTI